MQNTVLLTATIALFGAGNLSARSACLPADEALDQRIHLTIRLVTSTEPDYVRAREYQQLPAVPASEVQAIAVDSVCATARDSYNAALPLEMQQGGRRVYLVRVGDRYVVEDPGLRLGEFGLAMIMDRSFVVLRKLMR